MRMQMNCSMLQAQSPHLSSYSLCTFAIWTSCLCLGSWLELTNCECSRHRYSSACSYHSNQMQEPYQL